MGTVVQEPVYDQDTTLSLRVVRDFGLLWLCLLPTVSHWANKVVNAQMARSFV